jgi:hypothetical protein
MSFRAKRGSGVIVLRTPAAMLDYELAVADYCYGRDRSTLYRALFALGISPGDCHWHAAHPGQSRVGAYTDCAAPPATAASRERRPSGTFLGCGL